MVFSTQGGVRKPTAILALSPMYLQVSFRHNPVIRDITAFYSKQTISICRWIWNKVKIYMNDNHIKNRNSESVSGYLTYTYGDKPISKLSRHQKHCVRCALCLAQFVETVKMIEVIRRREPITFTGEVGEQIKIFIEYKKSFRLQKWTLRAYCWYLYPFGQVFNYNIVKFVKRFCPVRWKIDQNIFYCFSRCYYISLILIF